MESEDGKTICTACGAEVLITDGNGRCADCSSVCHYCSRTKQESGKDIDVIMFNKAILLAHRDCHRAAQLNAGTVRKPPSL